ncbi:MAG: SRPBCC family protein [Pirellulales bacterium]|nr:SRPBCC family protein [Pirellulales bacterium]
MWWKRALLGVMLIIGVFFLTVGLQPTNFQVVRTAKIAAPSQVVFAQVNNLREWEDWSPWAKKDPQMKTTYAGPAAGKGAEYSWNGNSDVGEGKMTITNSLPGQEIDMRLEFVRPFAGTNDVEFDFVPDGTGTIVTWKMSGKNDFLGKAVSLFINMDEMVGKDFEKGLAQLKTICEAEAGIGMDTPSGKGDDAPPPANPPATGDAAATIPSTPPVSTVSPPPPIQEKQKSVEP